MDPFSYNRRNSSVVRIGTTHAGGNYPVRIQSMANVSTMDTEAAVAQAIRMIEAGAEYVRFTAQGEREARNLGVIRKALTDAGYAVPLIADIHFNPKAADAAAQEVEKVRINPGNYVDRVKTFDQLEYTDEEYALEILKIRERFVPFLELCKKHHTAIRIGVNHGSLSDRIMSRYGDTPEGMVASCMEFLRICRDEDFADVVISIKASNTVVMVRTVRLLVDTMKKEDMYYPLHLGVTEAGDGEDGRIKSAVGIGTLLADGIGDTIRVSLSEEPEAEIPVARKLVAYIQEREDHPAVKASLSPGYNPIDPSRRLTRKVRNIGGGQVPVVISDRSNGSSETNSQLLPDYFYTGNADPENFPAHLHFIVDACLWNGKHNIHPYFTASDIEDLKNCPAPVKFISLSYADLSGRVLEVLKQELNTVVILSGHCRNVLGSQRAAIHKLITGNCLSPVILQRDYCESDIEFAQIKAGVDFGALLLDGFGDGILLQNDALPAAITDSYMFGILQATRLRISKTEYISCPGCGRTLFNLQSTIARVKEATSHLKGLKIGIMGCIVNGPGEMADADYGYIGAGRGRISLYKGKERILKNIPEEDAVERLVELIKENGDWHS